MADSSENFSWGQVFIASIFSSTETREVLTRIRLQASPSLGTQSSPETLKTLACSCQLMSADHSQCEWAETDWEWFWCLNPVLSTYIAPFVSARRAAIKYWDASKYMVLLQETRYRSWSIEYHNVLKSNGAEHQPSSNSKKFIERANHGIPNRCSSFFK